MDSNVYALLSLLFMQVWRLFTGWCFPGTKITPAAFCFFSMALGVGLRLLKKYFMGGDDNG